MANVVLKDIMYAVHRDDKTTVYTITKIAGKDAYRVSWEAGSGFDADSAVYSSDYIERQFRKDVWFETNSKGEIAKEKLTTVEMLAAIKAGDKYKVIHHEKSGSSHNGKTVQFSKGTKMYANVCIVHWSEPISGQDFSPFTVNDHTLLYTWVKVEPKREAKDFWEAYTAYKAGDTIENHGGSKFNVVQGSSVYFCEKDIDRKWYIYN